MCAAPNPGGLGSMRLLRSLPDRLTSRRGAWISLSIMLVLFVALMGLSPVRSWTPPAALDSAGISGTTADQLAESTRHSAGTTISQLRTEGTASTLGDQTDAAITALATGFADGTRWTLLVASVFLVLGLVGATRLRRVSRTQPS